MQTVTVRLFFVIVTLFLLNSCTLKEDNMSENGKEIEIMSKMSLFEHAKTYYQFFASDNNRVPKVYLPSMKVRIDDLREKKPAQLKTVWLGHSSLLINIDNHLILTDPVFYRKVSPVGPVNFHLKPVLEPNKLPDIDCVIISHDHYDHLNKCSILKIDSKVKRFVVPKRVGKILVKWGIDSDKITELNWYQDYIYSENLKITATPSQHFSGRGLLDRNKTLWASWVIKSNNHNVFFSGDSGYFDGFKEIGEKYGPFDVTYLECGAYDKKWSKVHMFPEETAQAHLDLKGKLLQPIHMATFNLALHPWFEPMERLVVAARRKGIVTSTPVPGKIVDYNQPLTDKHWWKPLIPEKEMIASAAPQSL